MSTVEEHQLPDNEWIVIFYHQTCALRLLPTLAAAKQHLSKHAWATNIFKSPREFQQQFDHLKLEKLWVELYERTKWRQSSTMIGPFSDEDATPPDLPTEQFCEELWKFMQRVGDRVTRQLITRTKSKDHYEICKDKLKVLMADEATFKKTYPKQARLILEALVALPSPYALEDELEKMMTSLVARGTIKTKQPAWRLMQFYRPQFIKDGYLMRGQDNYNEELDEDLAA